MHTSSTPTGTAAFRPNESPLAARNAGSRYPVREAAHRSRQLSADAQRAGLGLQSEDEPLSRDGGDRGRGAGGARQPEKRQPGDGDERRAGIALLAQPRARAAGSFAIRRDPDRADAARPAA